MKKEDIKIPNIPRFLGKGLGKLLHIPFEFVVGVKEGFTNEVNAQKAKEKQDNG